jgi:hypothetical protein
MSSLSAEVIGTHLISEISWRVVMTDKHDYYVLYKLALLTSDRGSDVIRKLVKYYKEARWLMSWLIKAVPFMLPVVYTVTLSPVRLYMIAEDVLYIERISDLITGANRGHLRCSLRG